MPQPFYQAALSKLARFYQRKIEWPLPPFTRSIFVVGRESYPLMGNYKIEIDPARRAVHIYISKHLWELRIGFSQTHEGRLTFRQLAGGKATAQRLVPLNTGGRDSMTLDEAIERLRTTKPHRHQEKAFQLTLEVLTAMKP